MRVIERQVSEHKAVLVKRGATGQPLGARLGTDQRKQSRTLYDHVTPWSRDPYGAKAPLTVQKSYFRVQAHVNASMRFDTVDQITRHALTQVRTANNERHGTAALRQEHSRLTRRVI